MNWREVWEVKQKQRMRPLKIVYEKDFRAKFSDDYSEQAKWVHYLIFTRENKYKAFSIFAFMLPI